MRKKDNTDYYIHRYSCFLLLEADTMTSPAELAKVWVRQDAFTHAHAVQLLLWTWYSA